MTDRIYKRVRRDMPPGHVRTPAYLRGKTGYVERTLGPFPNPEERAYGREGTALSLIRLRFTMSEIWGEAAENPHDTLDAEIYEHWLEPAGDVHAT